MAVEIEHEVFRSCKSANLYKAAVLKRVSVFECNSCNNPIIRNHPLYIHYGLIYSSVKMHINKQVINKELTWTSPKSEQSFMVLCIKEWNLM